MGKRFEKVILKIIKRHIEGRNLLYARQFGFRVHHSTILQCMTLNFNNKMSKAVVFLDIEKAFDTIWHRGLLYTLSKLEFSTSVIKLRVSVQGKMPTPKHMQAGVPQGSILPPTLYNLYINDTPQTHSVHLTLFADDTCLYATERKGGYDLRKLQHGLNSKVSAGI
jgi:retron-type reverse transcriptase